MRMQAPAERKARYGGRNGARREPDGTESRRLGRVR